MNVTPGGTVQNSKPGKKKHSKHHSAKAQAPQPQVFMVQLPPGAMAGQQMMITSPFTGQDMTVVVPMGVPPGGQFQVQG